MDMPGNSFLLLVVVSSGGDDEDDEESFFAAPSGSVMGGSGPVVDDGCRRSASATFGGIPIVKPKDEDIFSTLVKQSIGTTQAPMWELLAIRLSEQIAIAVLCWLKGWVMSQR